MTDLRGLLKARAIATAHMERVKSGPQYFMAANIADDIDAAIVAARAELPNANSALASEAGARLEALELAERAGIDMLDDHHQFIDDLTKTILRFAALRARPDAKGMATGMSEIKYGLIGTLKAAGDFIEGLQDRLGATFGRDILKTIDAALAGHEGIARNRDDLVLQGLRASCSNVCSFATTDVSSSGCAGNCKRELNDFLDEDVRNMRAVVDALEAEHVETDIAMVELLKQARIERDKARADVAHAHQKSAGVSALADRFEATMRDYLDDKAGAINQADVVAILAALRARPQSDEASEVIRCDHCDNGIEPAWPYCAWCGQAVASDEETDPAPGPQSDEVTVEQVRAALPPEAKDQAEEVAGAINQGEYIELPLFGDSRRRPQSDDYIAGLEAGAKVCDDEADEVEIAIPRQLAERIRALADRPRARK